MSFNEAQTEAIHHKEGPLLIIAGPGSGKTTVIVNRTKNLIEEHHIDPRKILVVTFTKSAAEEMGIRFQKLCLEEEDPDQYTGVHFGTIHSICFQILVSYFGYDYSQLIQENEKYRILYALAKQYDFASLDYNKFIADVAKAIGYIKNCDGKDINYSKFDVSEYQVKKMMKGYQEVLVIIGIIVWTVVVGYFISGLDIATDFYNNKTLETAIIYIDACASAVGIANGLFIFFRLREQWIAWYICAFLEAVINIMSGQYVLLPLKLGYFTNTTYGYIKWSRYIKEHQNKEKVSLF